MATPPASVAFCTCTMSSLPVENTVAANADRHAPSSATRVFIRHKTRGLAWMAPAVARAPLKDGQKMNRNMVPSIAVTSEV